MSSIENDSEASSDVTDGPVLGQLFEGASSAEYHYFVDAVVEALEQRIIEELDRRGGRYRGGF